MSESLLDTSGNVMSWRILILDTVKNLLKKKRKEKKMDHKPLCKMYSLMSLRKKGILLNRRNTQYKVGKYKIRKK